LLIVSLIAALVSLIAALVTLITLSLLPV